MRCHPAFQIMVVFLPVWPCLSVTACFMQIQLYVYRFERVLGLFQFMWFVWVMWLKRSHIGSELGFRPWRQHQQHQVKVRLRLGVTVVPSSPLNFVTQEKNNSTLTFKGAAEFCIGKMMPQQLLIWLIYCRPKPVKGACSTSEDRHRQAELCQGFPPAGLFSTPTNSHRFPALEHMWELNPLKPSFIDKINDNGWNLGGVPAKTPEDLKLRWKQTGALTFLSLSYKPSLWMSM